MSQIPIEIEKVTTNVALGSVLALGVFFCIDASNDNFLNLFETYVSMESFGVIAAIPILAIIYMVGAFVSLTSDFVFEKFNKEGFETEWMLMGEVIRANNSIMASKFTELYIQKKILEGSVFPLAVLSIGIFLERVHLPSLSLEISVFAGLLLFLTICIPLFTKRIQNRMKALVDMHQQYVGV